MSEVVGVIVTVLSLAQNLNYISHHGQLVKLMSQTHNIFWLFPHVVLSCSWLLQSFYHVLPPGISLVTAAWWLACVCVWAPWWTWHWNLGLGTLVLPWLPWYWTNVISQEPVHTTQHTSGYSTMFFLYAAILILSFTFKSFLLKRQSDYGHAYLLNPWRKDLKDEWCCLGSSSTILNTTTTTTTTILQQRQQHIGYNSTWVLRVSFMGMGTEIVQKIKIFLMKSFFLNRFPKFFDL